MYRAFAAAHNMPGIASAATSVLIGHVAGKTSTNRVESGGVMLPNHSPLVIAEQFGTLDARRSFESHAKQVAGNKPHVSRAFREPAHEPGKPVSAVGDQ